MEDRLNKLREERAAREKARIQKLRDINLKKYPKSEQVNVSVNQPSNSSNKLPKSTGAVQIKNGTVPKNVYHVCGEKNVRNNFHVNGTTKRPVTAPVLKKIDYANVKPKVDTKIVYKTSNTKVDAKVTDNVEKPLTSNIIGNVEKIDDADKTKVMDNQNNDKTNTDKPIDAKVLTDITKKEIVNHKIFTKNYPKSRKSLAAPSNIVAKSNTNIARKSMLPKIDESSKSVSVFERLYKPKYINAKKTTDDADKIETDLNYLKKKSSVIPNKRHTLFDSNKSVHPRRSISAVHFKRISKNEIRNCIYKWSSNEKLDKGDLELNEDEKIQEDKVVSAIKSERKRVTFMTPMPPNFNTPRPEELQTRLKAWLQKRGKSLSSYQHLQCFGINHLKTELGTPKHNMPNGDYGTPSNINFDEENKENIALDSDSDDGSYLDTMNEPKETLCSGDKIDIKNWRRVSIDSESVGFNESINLNEPSTPADSQANVDELLIGALNDLAALLREGFEWQQSARWLRSIRERFPHAPHFAAYWECRAALEDSRGDMTASLYCWQEAIIKGTEHSVVESNVDQLLKKFMQLKISPRSSSRQPDSRLVDVKNAFKSTLIRFAVQRAKLCRQSEQIKTPVFTVTPVRRSARLSRSATPRALQLCDSVRHAATVAPQHVFTPNENFVTP